MTDIPAPVIGSGPTTATPPRRPDSVRRTTTHDSLGAASAERDVVMTIAGRRIALYHRCTKGER